MHLSPWSGLGLLVLSLTGCASNPPVALLPCDEGQVRLVTDFEGARAQNCERLGPAQFSVTIAPEAEPINPSPWYAFDLQADQEADIAITMTYAASRHRYHPKQKTGDEGWLRLADERVSVSADGISATLNIEAERESLRIAAQELFPPSERLDWVRSFADRNGLALSEIGSSIDNLPILAAVRAAPDPKAPLIILIGGQHPPEVPGTLGMRHFLDTLFEDQEDAALLDRYNWLIVPELNPDGIAAGNWRLNLGDRDLNRDWGLFTQPETRAVKAEIDRWTSDGIWPVLLLDFHATRRNVLYTPPDDLELMPDHFTTRWLDELKKHWDRPLPDRSASHNPGLPTARTWFSTTYQAPGLTVEFADDIDRGTLEALSQAMAKALLPALETIMPPQDHGS